MKKTYIKRISKNRASKLREYSLLSKEYLSEHPQCEVCGDPSEVLHHKRGRGIYLNRTEWFLACCNLCHNRIHRSPGWARSQGFMLDRIGKI